MLEVPTTPFTVAPEVLGTAVPRLPTHSTDVAAVQLEVAHSASTSSPVTVAFVGPNSKPVNVMLTTAVARLYGDAAVTTGAVDVV